MRLHIWRRTQNLPGLGPEAVWGWERFFFIPSLWSLFGSGLSTFYFSLWDGCENLKRSLLNSIVESKKRPADTYSVKITPNNLTYADIRKSFRRNERK